MSRAEAALLADWEMSTGDVNSKAMGTGARAHGGKARWELMSLKQVAYILDNEEDVYNVLDDMNEAGMIRRLGEFQAGDIDIEDLLLGSVAYNWHTQENVEGTTLTILESLENVIKVWEFGLHKYSEFNWATGMNWSIPIACAVRHVRDHHKAYAKDSAKSELHYDAESKELHSAHVVCNVMMLAHYSQYWKEGDDRPLFAFPKGE